MKLELPSIVILSAGFSSRMGQPKANVLLHEKTFLTHILDLIPPAFPVLVVLGFQADQVRRQHPHLQGKWVENPEFSQGMIVSLKAGLRSLNSSCPGFWLWPVDFPCLQVDTVRLLFQASLNTPEIVIVPSHHYHRGHPVYIPRSCFSEIDLLPNEAILRTILFRESRKILYVDVEDSGVLQNLNTMADLQHFQ